MSANKFFPALVGLLLGPGLFFAGSCRAEVVDEGDVLRLDLVSTESPRATLRSFYSAMEDYRRGVETNDPQLRARIDDAVRTLNLVHISPLTRLQEGRELAILLKEVLDRAIVLDYARIP